MLRCSQPNVVHESIRNLPARGALVLLQFYLELREGSRPTATTCIPSSRLKGLNIPALVITGDHDFFPFAAEHIAQAIPGARLPRERRRQFSLAEERAFEVGEMAAVFERHQVVVPITADLRSDRGDDGQLFPNLVKEGLPTIHQPA